MAYVSKFENDIFISYAHVDNRPQNPIEEGWVKKFQDSLEVRLRQIIGRAEGLSIWRDPALQGNDEFDETIRTAFRNSAVMVSILSPSYIQSRWCQEEVGQFCDAASDTVKIDKKSRVFKVLLSNVKPEQHPAPLQGSLGYPFFELDGETDREKRFRRTKEDDADQRYWEKLDDLAKAIARLLESLKNEQDKAKDSQHQYFARKFDSAVGPFARLGRSRSESNSGVSAPSGQRSVMATRGKERRRALSWRAPRAGGGVARAA